MTIRNILLCALLVTLSACGNVDQQAVDSLTQEMKTTFAQLKEELTGLSPKVQSLTKEEIDKLYIWEYKVDKLPADYNTEQLEELLSSLGKDRWETVTILPHTNQLQVVSKRRPLSYLRYIPRMVP